MNFVSDGPGFSVSLNFSVPAKGPSGDHKSLGRSMVLSRKHV